MPIPENKQLVTKSNALVRSKFQLTLAEMRLLLCVIAQLNPNEKLESSKIYYVHAQTYASNYGLQLDNVYKILREAIDLLYDRSVKVRRGNGENVEFRWIQAKSYIDKKGKVGIKLTEDILPYLSELQSHYTQYFFNETKKIDSVYAIRLFEIAKSYLSLNQWSVGLDDFREIFSLKPDYRQDNIQKRIIAPSLAAINEHTSLNISCEPFKVGRAIAGYTFSIKEIRKVVAVKPKIKAAIPDDKNIGMSWNTSENYMLDQLLKKGNEYKKADIEAMAIKNNSDILSVLHALNLESQK